MLSASPSPGLFSYQKWVNHASLSSSVNIPVDEYFELGIHVQSMGVHDTDSKFTITWFSNLIFWWNGVKLCIMWVSYTCHNCSILFENTFLIKSIKCKFRIFCCAWQYWNTVHALVIAPFSRWCICGEIHWEKISSRNWADP